MNKLVDFIQAKQVGLWCKRGAWIIAAIGIVNILLSFFAFFPLGSGYPITGAQILNSITQVLRLGLSTLSLSIFYFFVLYAAGTLVEIFVGEVGKEGEEELEDEEEESVNEALMPGQRLH